MNARFAPAPAAPRGLLLDFGSVITVSVFERHRETEKILGLPAGVLDWYGPLDPGSDPLWRSMVADQISEREYWRLRALELGNRVGESGWDMLTMLTRIRQIDPTAVVRPMMRSLIRRAHLAGVRVGILTNEMELFYGRPFLQRMDILGDIDAVVDATHNGILKPDPRAYQLAIDAMKLPAENILFVDDQFRNIAGAIASGLHVQYFDLRDIEGNTAAVCTRLRLPPERV